ncbi:glutathione S-transferase N-terminal domain-containing protein [Rhizobium hidalgonense]|uniref:glutathione S-transferase N-terminal domain-containing protein n=1 Tax=Rhizobium hidalgonense TaxID=1538159 RepID=UPI0011058DAE|nr:glutathione S-transferase N-terminal domain-containing protein [Rhizobium hidalgonense]QKK24572.1 glutathione S-transferase N-terminal domain-containing protein [Rhizobium hidalgonense]
MKLYMHAAACSLSPHIICRELGVDIELVQVDRQTHKTSDGKDYLSINGNGYVPALMLDDGKVLTEGPAIVQFLAEGSALLPELGDLSRSEVQSYLNFITAELHKPMVLLFNPAYSGVHGEIRALISKRLTWLNGRLAGAYLTGEAFTVADAYLFVCLNWSPWTDIDLKQWPDLHGFMARVAARPKVREALQAEDLEAFDADGVYFAPQAYLASAGRTGEPVRP